jgi:hypothetical protein
VSAKGACCEYRALGYAMEYINCRRQALTGATGAQCNSDTLRIQVILTMCEEYPVVGSTTEQPGQVGSVTASYSEGDGFLLSVGKPAILTAISSVHPGKRQDSTPQIRHVLHYSLNTNHFIT